MLRSEDLKPLSCRQQAYLKDDLHYMKQSVDKIQALINDCLETTSHYNKEKNGENQ